jgi:hypothetical protein
VSCHPFCMTYGDTMRVQGAGGRGGGGVPPAAAAQVLLPRSALHRELLLPEGQGAGVDLPPARQGKPQQLPRAVVLPRSRSLVVKRKAFTPPFASKNLHFPFFDPLIFNETVEHLTFMVKKNSFSAASKKTLPTCYIIDGRIISSRNLAAPCVRIG